VSYDSLQTDFNCFAHLCNAIPKSGKEIEKRITQNESIDGQR
jgi:hypothetical protein